MPNPQQRPLAAAAAAPLKCPHACGSMGSTFCARLWLLGTGLCSRVRKPPVLLQPHLERPVCFLATANQKVRQRVTHWCPAAGPTSRWRTAPSRAHRGCPCMSVPVRRRNAARQKARRRSGDARLSHSGGIAAAGPCRQLRTPAAIQWDRQKLSGIRDAQGLPDGTQSERGNKRTHKTVRQARQQGFCRASPPAAPCECPGACVPGSPTG